MNLKKIIVAMALAAGLLSSGTQAQAGVVINNYLFTPITIKMSYTDSSSGKKVKVTNKSILNDLGYPAGTFPRRDLGGRSGGAHSPTSSRQPMLRNSRELPFQ